VKYFVPPVPIHVVTYYLIQCGQQVSTTPGVSDRGKVRIDSAFIWLFLSWLSSPHSPITVWHVSCYFCGRYHRCQGDPDGHVFTHRLLTEGFREDEVYQPSNVVILPPTAEQFSAPALRWLITVSGTFQDVDFNGSLLPFFITWCYNHGIKKLPNHRWTRWYHFRDTIGYHRNTMTCQKHP